MQRHNWKFSACQHAHTSPVPSARQEACFHFLNVSDPLGNDMLLCGQANQPLCCAASHQVAIKTRWTCCSRCSWTLLISHIAYIAHITHCAHVSLSAIWRHRSPSAHRDEMLQDVAEAAGEAAAAASPSEAAAEVAKADLSDTPPSSVGEPGDLQAAGDTQSTPHAASAGMRCSKQACSTLVCAVPRCHT